MTDMKGNISNDPAALKWLVMKVVEPGFELQALPALMDKHPLPSDDLSKVSSWGFELIMSCIDLDEDDKAYLRETPEVVDKIIAARMFAPDDISALIMHDRDTIRGPRNFAKAVDALDGKGTPEEVSKAESRGELHPLDTPEEAMLRAQAAKAIRDAEFLAKHPFPPKPVRRGVMVNTQNTDANPQAQGET